MIKSDPFNGQRIARRHGGQSLVARRAWYADETVTAANVLRGANAKTTFGIAGATITAGMALYLDSATMTLKLGDNDTSPATSNVVGIALVGGASGQQIEYDYDDDDFTPGFTMSLSGIGADGIYVLGAANGGIAPVTDLAAGDYPVVLMVAKSTTKAVLKIVRGGAVLV